MNRKQVSNNLDDYVEYLCKEFEKYGSKKYVQGKEITTYFLVEELLLYTKSINLKKYYPLLLTVLIFLLIANLHLRLLFII